MSNTTLRKKISKNIFFYAMLLPVILYFLVFSYYPLLLGIHTSFHQVRLLGGATFVGFDNYVAFWNHPQFQQAMVNTIVVGVVSFALQFLAALVLSVMINEIRVKFFKSSVQTVTYLPHLLSWAIVGGLWINLLSPNGFVNSLLRELHGPGFSSIVFMAEPRFARAIMILSGAWKNVGFTIVLLLAAIVSVDQGMYEAAHIDGASRIKQIQRITIPSIIPTMKVVIMLGTMGLLRNFDQIYIMSRATIDPQVRNMLVWIFVQGIERFQLGLATAAASFVLAATLVLTFAVRKLIRYDQSYE